MTSDTIEQAVIGSMLISPDAIVTVFEAGITASHFHQIRHQHIYRAIESLAASGAAVDLVTVTDRLVESDLLVEAGGHAAVQNLFDVMPTAANVSHYIKRLRAYHAERTRRESVERAANLLKEGHTELAAHVLAEQPPRHQAAQPLKSEAFADVQPDLTRTMLVEGWLPQSSMAVIYGPSGTGKSFFSLDLALHVAMGWPWHGKQVTQGTVIYVAAEAPESMRARFAALKVHYPNLKNHQVPLYLVAEQIDFLSSDESVDALVELVNRLTGGTGAAMLLVDTLARTMAGGDENDFRTMSLLTDRLEKVRASTQATVVAIHHTGKDVNKGARGHSCLKAAAESMIELSRQGDEGARLATLEKSRDGEDGLRIGFDLVSVEIGSYPGGNMATSAVVSHLLPEQIRRPLEGRNLEALQILKQLLSQTAYGVRLELWRDQFVRSLDGVMTLKTARASFARTLKTLVPSWVKNDAGTVNLAQDKKHEKSTDSVLATSSNQPPEPRQHRESAYNNAAVLPNPGGATRKVTNLATYLESASRAEATSATSGQQGNVLPAAKAPGNKATPPYKGVLPIVAAVPSDVEEAQAKARIESLRPKTKEESDDAFSAMLDAIEKK